MMNRTDRNKVSLLVRMRQCIFAGTLLGCAGTVQATPLMAPSALNLATFDTAQNTVDVGSPGLSVGDLVYGVVNVTSIQSGGAVVWDARNVPGPGVDSLSGYYLAQVVNVTPLPAPYAAAVSLGPAANDPNGIFSTSDLSNGTIVKLFSDTTTPFQTTGVIANDIAKASDGQFWASFGVNGGYWDAVALANGLVFGSEGLNLIGNQTGYSLDFIQNPMRPALTPVQIYISTSAELTGDGGWQYAGSNTAYLQPSSVPEPHEVLLMVIGLAGLLMSRRYFI